VLLAPGNAPAVDIHADIVHAATESARQTGRQTPDPAADVEDVVTLFQSGELLEMLNIMCRAVQVILISLEIVAPETEPHRWDDHSILGFNDARMRYPKVSERLARPHARDHPEKRRYARAPVLLSTSASAGSSAAFP
jgi:hypothetical protein